MLDAIGVDTVDDLFDDVPADKRLTELLNITGGYDELKLRQHLTSIARQNTSVNDVVSFLGGGCYAHYIPSCINHILTRPEFFTAYTPYQPEVSQGTLQAIYEYQTGICELTGMDIANASMYDGATALVEAAFMCVRLAKKRSKVIVSGTLNPQWIETLKTYASSGLIELEVLDNDAGLCDLSHFESVIDDQTAAVLLSYPNYFGFVEDIQPIIELAHERGAYAVVAANPIMLAVLQSPGSLGADVVVGEGQALGNSMSFGGPGLGFFACREACTRQMPGRIVGRTVDSDEAVGYVLTLSTREQHIRREKATSNICSNHALNALAAGAYLATVGPVGLSRVATLCIARAHHLYSKLLETNMFDSVSDAPFGYEFTLRFNGVNPHKFHDSMVSKGYLPGLLVDDSRMFVFAVTELVTRDQIDTFVNEVSAYVE